ncbi:response regulator [Pararhodobacter sp. CCB-MM2]|uniref:response regulator n=1 Tax=Pararhodobacter sp. CCB-MM2 TaxID=1786003 RepID=UPI000833A3A4|nr:response regulator [Pararhodobacter sp. CCB-MM2]
MADDPIRFLIVDDKPENLMALEALLRRDGLEVHRAGSAAEALELMLVHDYALALLDVHMPKIDGYELAELMRGAERTRRLPIIFVTASEQDDTRRFRGYEAGAVDFIFKPIDPVILKSKAEVFFRIGQQARDLARQRDEMRAMAAHRDQALAQLKAHADNSPLGMVELDGDLVIRNWSKGAERIFGRPASQMVGHRPDQAGWLTPEAVATLRGWLATPLAEAPPRHTLETEAMAADGRSVDVELYGSVLNGGRQSLAVQGQDVTERRQAENTRSLLIGELNHRIKNTLANVQAIARQTLRQSATLPEFDKGFSGRLQALARAHSILSDATWASAPLERLIEDQVKAGTLDCQRLHRAGPAVEISPENMLRLALTLHELGTNAQKYGALSVPGGEVWLDWRVEGAGLVLTWRETGGPAVAAPARTGFGTTLIESTGGSEPGMAQADWQPGGVIWTIRLPSGVTALRAPTTEVVPMAANSVPGEDDLAGRRVLLIEDEPLVVLDLSCEIEEAGAEIVAVARTLPDALRVAGEVAADVAVLDGNLNGESVVSVAELLAKRGIPFCFVSGYGREHLPRAFRDVPLVQKPFDPDALRHTLRGILQTDTAMSA